VKNHTSGTGTKGSINPFIINKGVDGLAIYNIKKALQEQKKELWKLKYFTTMQKI
jgi:hypothetical protein